VQIPGQEPKQDIGLVVSGNMIRLTRLLEIYESEDTQKEAPSIQKTTYVSKEDAKQIYDKMKYTFDFNEFLAGMNVEMEHKDLTNGDLEKTAMIAAAHLRELPNYYTLLKKLEK